MHNETTRRSFRPARSRWVAALAALTAAVPFGVRLAPAAAQTPAADLAVTNTVDRPLATGGTNVVFTVTVTNNGPDTATAVSVVDALPSGLAFVSDDGAGAYAAPTWTVGNLAAAASATLHITASVSAVDGATATSVATVSALSPADPVPANNTASTVVTTRIDDLCARAGSTTLPGGAVVPVLGYVAGDCTTTTVPSAPGGPAIVANQGDVVTVTLHNGLAESSSLLFQGQAIAPDLAGIAAGGSKAYTFTASGAGTFLYEAGLRADAQTQVARGLYGVLVVRSNVAGTAYGTSATAYDDEAVVVLSELDPAVTGNGIDLRNYKPTYGLVNGRAHPDTAPITAGAGRRLLVRYVNAGLLPHSMVTLGLRQQFVANDGSALRYSHDVAADTLAPGQTADAIVAVPATAAAGAKFAIYDGSMTLHNAATGGLGGMLAFVAVGTGTAGPAGPATSALAVAPPYATATVTATVTAAGTATVADAEAFVDVQGADGTGSALTGAFGGASANVSGTLGALIAGPHTVYVHGRDSLGVWGPAASVAVVVPAADTTGPATSAVAIAPARTNGSVPVVIDATASDVATGGSTIAAAELFVDTVGATGSGTALTVNNTTTTAGLHTQLAAATANALANGTHVVSLHSRDSAGNWGAFVTATLTIDKVGPVVTAVVASPNPNNGAYVFNSATPALRVTATVNDTAAGGSNIATAEASIGPVAAAAGSGIAFLPTDGQFDSPSEGVTLDIPLATINALPNGNHTIHVRGRDAAGSWTASTSTTVLVIDRTPPVFSAMSIAPLSIVQGTPSVTMTITATDAGGIGGGEYWFGTTNPAAGGGTPFTGGTPSIATGSLNPGTYTVRARARDAAGNWSTNVLGATLTVTPTDAIFANGFEALTGAAVPWGWTAATPANIPARLTVNATAAMNGALGLQAQNNNTNYVQYTFGTPASPTTRTFDARFAFRPNSATSAAKDIFVGATDGGFVTPVFRVRYRLNGTQPQVQIQLGGGTANGAWSNASGAVANTIEVLWNAGTNLRLYVNGSLVQTLATTSAAQVGAFRVGSVTTGGGNNTAMYFDNVGAKRSLAPLFGP